MNVVQLLRIAGIIEGISWLLLLFVAMPLKYGLGRPQAVQVVGMIHGILFITFVLLLGACHFSRRWPILRSALFFVAALVPFGFLFVDRRVQEAALTPSRGL